MSDGQLQLVLFSSITWLPGHRGAGRDLGEVVVKDAANVRKAKNGRAVLGETGGQVRKRAQP